MKLKYYMVECTLCLQTWEHIQFENKVHFTHYLQFTNVLKCHVETYMSCFILLVYIVKHNAHKSKSVLKETFLGSNVFNAVTTWKIKMITVTLYFCIRWRSGRLGHLWCLSKIIETCLKSFCQWDEQLTKFFISLTVWL